MCITHFFAHQGHDGLPQGHNLRKMKITLSEVIA